MRLGFGPLMYAFLISFLINSPQVDHASKTQLATGSERSWDDFRIYSINFLSDSVYGLNYYNIFPNQIKQLFWAQTRHHWLQCYYGALFVFPYLMYHSETLCVSLRCLSDGTHIHFAPGFLKNDLNYWSCFTFSVFNDGVSVRSNPVKCLKE